MTINLTAEQIDALELGAASGWFSDSLELEPTEENAMSYLVIGLPENMTAMVHRARPGSWYFVVHGYPQEDFEDKASADDKDAALEALKGWLKTQQWPINRA